MENIIFYCHSYIYVYRCVGFFLIFSPLVGLAFAQSSRPPFTEGKKKNNNDIKNKYEK